MTFAHTKLAWLLLFAVALTSGCISGGFTRSGTGSSADSETSAGGDSQAADIDIYLETMRDVIEGDALTRAEVLRRVEESADLAPTTTNRLLYALLISVPGHSASDANEAQRRLTALLAAGDALLPAERLLAIVQLRDVEQRLVLEVTAAELRSELATAESTSDAAAERRIQSLIDDNRRLQNELEDATEKLNAITSIEQSIRELEDGSD